VVGIALLPGSISGGRGIERLREVRTGCGPRAAVRLTEVIGAIEINGREQAARVVFGETGDHGARDGVPCQHSLAGPEAVQNNPDVRGKLDDRVA